MFENNKNKNKNNFDTLPIEIQSNIYYQNTMDYKQIVAKLLSDKKLMHDYYDTNLNILNSEVISTEYYLNICENKNNL